MDFGNLAMTFWGSVDAFYNKEGLPMDYGTSLLVPRLVV